MSKLSGPVLGEGQIEPCGAKIGEERLCSHHNNTVIIKKKKPMGSAKQGHGSKCTPPPNTI